MSVVERRGRGNALNKLAYDEVEKLARRMWNAYVRSQPVDDRSHYVAWEKLVDDETPRGFRAVARMVLRERTKKKAARRIR